MASLAEVPNTQACRTVASSSAFSTENIGHLLTSTMAPAKLGLPRRVGGGVRAARGEDGVTGGGWRGEEADGGGGEEQGAESSLLTLTKIKMRWLWMHGTRKRNQAGLQKAADNRLDRCKHRKMHSESHASESEKKRNFLQLSEKHGASLERRHGMQSNQHKWYYSKASMLHRLDCPWNGPNSTQNLSMQFILAYRLMLNVSFSSWLGLIIF